MSGVDSLQNGITRRSFLKTTGAVAGAVAVGGALSPGLAAFAEDSDSTVNRDQVFHGVCRGNCMNGCPVEIHVREGKVARVSRAECPDPQYNRICLKGLSHPQRIYNPDRLLYPMKRVGERGAGEWERISWDEAISTICGKWKELREKYGPSSIGWWSQSGSFGLLNGCHTAGAYNRLTNTLQVTPISGAVDTNYYTANAVMYGSSIAYSYNEITDLRNARAVIVWGSNMTEAQMQQWHFLADALENGCKLIVIDPNFTTVAAKADMFVPIRPGTDAVLAFALANILIDNGLMDEPFMKASTVAPFLVKDSDGTYLRQSDFGQAEKGSKTDQIFVWDKEKQSAVLVDDSSNPVLEGSFFFEGISVTTAYSLLLKRIKEYPPEKASKVCEVPVDVMHEIVKVFMSNSPASIFQGFGQDRYYNGHSTYTAIGSFAMLTGNFGKPGASCGVYQPNSPIFDMKKCTTAIDQSSAQISGNGLASYAAGVLAHKLPDLIETNKYNGKDLTIKSIYINNCNPLNYSVERQGLIKVFEQMELVVACDIFMTDTTRYADIVLPVAHWFEVDDFTCGTAFLLPYVTLQEKAVDPPADCKSDYEILQLIADGMGVPGVYSGLSPEEAMRYVLDTDTAAKYGVNYDRLKKEKIVRYFPEKEFIFAEGGVFPTGTKRAQFYFENPKPNMQWGQEIDIDLERLPFFTPPQEAWSENELYKKYPIMCYQEHTRWRVHSNFSHVQWLRELDREPVVKINPVDAEARGLKNDDIVKVFNDRGYVVLKTVVSNGLRPGMCNIPKGWQKDQYIDGHYQDLTSRDTNPYVANSQYSDLLVEIEKIGVE